MEAVKPDKFFASIPSIKEKKAEVAISDEEKVLHGGSKTAFWKTLRTHIEELTADLDKINEAAIASGSSLDEIGMNAIVVNLTKGILGKLVNKVEDAGEGSEK